MAKTKAVKPLPPVFSCGPMLDHGSSSVYAVSDQAGNLWRLDVADGTMRPVTIEKPTPRRANAKPRRKRR